MSIKLQLMYLLTLVRLW